MVPVLWLLSLLLLVAGVVFRPQQASLTSSTQAQSPHASSAFSNTLPARRPCYPKWRRPRHAPYTRPCCSGHAMLVQGGLPTPQPPTPQPRPQPQPQPLLRQQRRQVLTLRRWPLCCLRWSPSRRRRIRQRLRQYALRGESSCLALPRVFASAGLFDLTVVVRGDHAAVSRC